MNILSRILLLVATSCLLAACTTPPVPFDASAEKIQTIGVLPPRISNTASVQLATSVGQSFGLIGALVDAGMQADRDSKFKQIADANNIQVQTIFLTALSDRLQQLGYKTAPIAFNRDAQTSTQASNAAGTEFIAVYPKTSDPAVDAYLDLVVLGYGYRAAGIRDETPYRPMFEAKVRLVDAKTSAVLMQDHLSYNPIIQDKNIVSIAPDPAYAFTTFDILMANPEKAVTGLKSATEQTASTIANLLKKQ
ncbi:hypothetical protein ACFSM5_13610 [Lacibacterium aquatile]|uniref:Lipoprotein n=1 Tax=Lacibacterium aquatile TaxID=1168082 RepID=A0ABW5DS08_9PROT